MTVECGGGEEKRLEDWLKIGSFGSSYLPNSFALEMLPAGRGPIRDLPL